MDFFQAQDNARQNTTRLVILFGLAVVTLILASNILVMAVLGFYTSTTGNDFATGRYVERVGQGQTGEGLFNAVYWDAFVGAFDWQVFFSVGAVVLLVVLLGSTYKIMSLSKGGRVIAEMLDGRRVLSNSRDPDERKLLNVVEEMAIASGSPVPAVYLLPQESSINAFAAGKSIDDAIIGVTQGCIKYLNRDQLQGVIAHEFSHILNGDMRLNLRIVGVLHGILVIGMIGYYMLRTTSYSSRRKGGGGLLIMGLGLMVIGFAGSFFGSLIKASVSRQREYLADASAIQFTRNPDGIADALKKIGGYNRGSRIENPAAPQVSHAFFACGVTSSFTDLFATHPPLDDRIHRIQPSWDGKYPAVDIVKPGVTPEIDDSIKPFTETKQVFASAVVATAVQDAISSMGQPSQQHIGYARRLIPAIPATLLTAAREPYHARALIHGLVLDKDAVVRQQQLQFLDKHADREVYSLVCGLWPEIESLPARFRLPLIDISAATLKDLSPQQYQRFKRNFQVLIKADKKISLFEWSLQRILFQYLDAGLAEGGGHKRAGHYSRLQALLPECALVLSLLARSEHQVEQQAQNAFAAGMRELQPQTPDMVLLGKDKLSLDRLNAAIDKLAGLKPLLKPRVLKACAACILSDDNVSASEVELLRAISAALDCPMPPIIMD